MSFLIGLLTFALVLLALVVIFLVLIQLPKKEAGVGVAFGGGATDALFGAGSGNVLTKTTKYAVGIFFGLALLIGALQSHFGSGHQTTKLEKALEEQATQPAPMTAPAAAPAAIPAAPATAPAAPAGTPAK